ncbi:MAG: DMT family transporter [Gammaproteobacteria bacterium]|nr:DMT family transporter [Gammaproteobacteria bacterium]
MAVERVLTPAKPSAIRSFVLTLLALVAFAGNSVLCRMALGAGTVDAASFTSIRLLSGALVLLLILAVNGKPGRGFSRGSWSASLMLFLYAVTFSFAYIHLNTGTGALILFGSVQITMILLALMKGTRLHLAEWLGVITAFGGFVYLVAPGVSAPPLGGFTLMAIAGAAWGVYTLKGRGSDDPLADTAGNFMRTLPLVAVLSGASVHTAQLSAQGILLAVLSGAVASGMGYTLWYSALRSLSASQAAVLQLLVPVLAALGGVVFIAEAISLRLIVSALLILGGILLVMLGSYYSGPRSRVQS